METDELIKLVDGIYKNILDKFNPGARQMINAGKAYLKALHGAAAASRLYVDAINKLAKQAQQGTWGGCSDVGASLMRIVEVYKEIQDQQMNILKAFYVDLLVPLETNLEKDTKVVQSEQKRFLQQHKQRAETYSKAAAMMKKQRKKSRSNTKTGLAMDKELKNMQVLEEEKTKLDAFCEQSLKNAMTQERRRYGFVLERHCSLAKHYLSYHTQGVSSYQQNIDKWTEVAKTREYLPESVENIFTNKMRQISVWQDEDLYSNPRSPHFDDDRMSINSQLRKTKSMDASCLDIRSIAEVGSPVTTMSRAKSEYNLNTSTHSLEEEETPTRRPKSIATPQTVPPPPQWDTQLARALYAYLSSGENQLSFLEGDLISLIGERNKGWQFGENLRTQTSGWFPLAYTEVLDDNNFSPSHSGSSGGHSNTLTQSGSVMSPASGVGSNSPVGNSTLESAPPSGGARMFGDTLHLHRSSANAKQIRRAMGSNPIPPPALPAPVPTPTIPYAVPHKPSITQSQSQNQFPTSKPPSGMDGPQQQSATHNGTSPYSQPSGLKTSTSSYNFSSSTTTQTNGPYSTHPQPSRSDSSRPATITPLPLHMQQQQGGGKGGKIGGGPVGNVSLHSSNDSGFSNDPPPQPEIDYSDDESIHGQQQGSAGSKVTAVRHRTKERRHVNGDDNNGSARNLTATRLSNSSGNLIDNRYYVSDDSGLDQRKLIKRTKSFWRFGKNSSDNEILEGMSLWRHRDLVDVDEKKAIKRRIDPKLIEKRRPRDTSNDSEKTINANNQYDGNDNTVAKKTQTVEKPARHRPSFNEKQKLSLLPRKESQIQSEHFEDNYPKPMARQSKRLDQFYDDGDDGLIMRTVNRKNILQQYTNDSTGPDTESESEITSEDPYDCIVVNDQTQKVLRKNGEHISNVAAIGKKLEKLSKNTKYSPNKDTKPSQTQPQNEIIVRNERNKIDKKVTKQDEIIQYQEKRQSFKTFGIEAQNSENGEEERNDDRYYHQQLRTKKSNELKNEKQRYYNSNIQSNTTERKSRINNIDAEVDVRNHRRIASEPNKKKDKYINSTNYDQRHRESTTADEYSDVTDGTRQYLLRGKISVDNSKYETDDTSLMDYGETIQRRLKSNDYGSKMEDKSPHSGNMYGPWYDLWGLDASVRK